MTYSIDIRQPLGSGFGATSTATDVLAGIDLSGRTAVVTGGYSGIGLETTRALAAAGARVVVPARRPEQARTAVGGIGGVEVDELDLADLTSVGTFSRRFLAEHDTIDILVNGAGVMATPKTRVGPGWELQFATNHLGHYALVNRLWPALAAGGGARVIAVSSRGHKFSDIRWNDVDFVRDYDRWQAYGQSKTANALFALHLDRLGGAHGVHAFSLHPGGIKTPLQRHLSREDEVAMGWIDEAGSELITWKSPEQGAATSVWAATSALLDGHGGMYLEDCDVAGVVDPSAPDAMRHGVHPHAADPASAARLWELSASLTGLDAFADA